MSNGSRTNFRYLSNDAICIIKQVDRKIILPRVITLPHFPLHNGISTSVDYLGHFIKYIDLCLQILCIFLPFLKEILHTLKINCLCSGNYLVIPMLTNDTKAAKFPMKNYLRQLNYCYLNASLLL